MLRILTPPTTEPITLSEAKSHLRVDEDFTLDDAYITALITVARDYAEGFQVRSLAPQTLELTMDCFPRGHRSVFPDYALYYAYSPIRLRRTPLVSVESITYVLTDGTEKVLPPSEYIVKVDGDIVPAYGKFWPIDILTTGDGVRVKYQAGYTRENIPATTKQGMLLLIGHWYENRETVVIGRPVAKVPQTAEMLLWMDRSGD